MSHKTPTQRLNEVLLQAAIRAELRREHRNTEQAADDLARQVANLNDELARMP
jgi:hypothetical protein